MITIPAVRHMTITLLRLLLIACLLLAWAGLPGSTYSAPASVTWYVGINGASDSYACTTPAQPCEHIQTVFNRAASGDTVRIAAGTYYGTLLISDKSLTVIGAGAATTILDGQLQGTVLTVAASGGSLKTISLSGVTIQNGQTSTLGGGVSVSAQNVSLIISDSNILNNIAQHGGGIFNQGIMKLQNVAIRANKANGAEGGGIWNTGYSDLTGVTIANNQAPRGGGISSINSLTITSSLIDNNQALGQYGGGIFNRSSASKLTLVNSTISRNQAVGTYGGGVANEGTFIGSGLIFTGNLALNLGGGVFNSSGGHVDLSSSSFNNNTALDGGGGLANVGVMQVAQANVRSNVSNKAGGGLYNDVGGNLTVGSTNIFSNTATSLQGGGISNAGMLTLTQSLLALNVASVKSGGGLYNGDTGTAQLTNVTISDNAATAGNGIQNVTGILSIQFSTISNTLNNTGGTVTVAKSILAPGSGAACVGSITSADYNLDVGTSCGLSQTHDLSSQNPQLGPLTDNGGPTLTRAIAFSSPAVDSASTCPSTPIDQRGVVRPQSDFCDRGAYEVVGYTNANALDFGANTCATSTLTINDQFAVGLMQAGVNLSYTGSRTDLTIRLLSPGTARVNLLGPGAQSGQNLNTMFDDSAATGVLQGDQTLGPTFYSYNYKPATALLQMRGVGLKGSWKLEICNKSLLTGGTLNRWVLVVPELSAFKVYLPLVRR